MIRTTQFTLSMLVASLLVSSTTAEAFSLRDKRVWASAAIAAIGLNIYWKMKKPAVPTEEETLIKSIKKAQNLNDFVYILQQWIIGYPETQNKIKIDTNGATKFAKDIILTMEKGTPAYGLCGVTWTYLKTIYESLKAIKDLNDTARFFDFVD